jgi:TolA-binding protein
MRIPVFRFILLLFGAVFSSHTLYAQRTAIYQSPAYLFEDAIEYYQKKAYGPARELFQAYHSKTESGIYKEQSKLYELICGVKLGNDKEARVLEKVLREQNATTLENDAYFALGNYYFQEKKYRRASRMYDKVSTARLSQSEFQEASFKIGYSYFADQEYDKAKRFLGQARSQEGTYYMPANYYYGYICYLEKNWSCALSSFAKLEGKGPKNIQLYTAQIHLVQQEYQLAIEKANSLLEEEKLRDDAILVIGKSYYQLQDYNKAKEYFELYSLPTEELQSDELYQFGNTYYEKKEYDKAFPYFVRLSAQDDDLGQLSSYQLAVSFLKLNRKQNAFNAFSEARRMSHIQDIKEIAHFNYVKLAFELGYQNVAVPELNTFIETYPESEFIDEARGILAESFLRTKNYKQAIAVLDQIKNLNWSSKKAYQRVAFNRAQELYLNKEFSESEMFFNKSLKYPINKQIEAEAHFWKAEMQYQLKNYSDAIAGYNRFINLRDAQNSKLYNTAFYSLGYCYYSQKSYPLALNYFLKYQKQEKFFGKAPATYIDNSLRLADCYFIQRQYNEAANAYGYVASKKYPGSDYAIFQQGMIYGLQNKPGMKISTMKRLVRDYKSSIYMDDALFEMANVYMSQQDYKNAESLLNQLISKHDASPFVADAYLTLGLIYYNQHIDNRAISYYKTVIEKYPRSEQAEEALRFIELIYVNSGRGDEYIDFIADIPNSNLRLTYQDSILYESAMIKYREGDCSRAGKAFHSYINRFGEKGYFIIPVNYYLGECEFYYGDKDKSLEYYRFVADQSRSDFSEKVYLRLAQVYFDRQELKKALRYYSDLEKAATTKTNYVLALIGEMRCNYLLGNKDAAKKNAIDILPIENISKAYVIEANFTLGKIQFEDMNYTTSLYHLNYVIEHSQNEKGAEAQYLKALVFYNKNDIDSSINAVFELNDRFSPYEYWVVKGFILLSDNYVAQKDYFQARATLQSILDGYDGDPELIRICKEKIQDIERLENPQSQMDEGLQGEDFPEEEDE